jgi:prepilin-type N-terminal cleavage/methylation domain-containing protein
MSRRDGFTLLEILLVIVIAVIFLTMAVPSVEGLFAEQRLKKTFEEFDDFVRRAQTRAVEERRAFVLIWDEGGITVQPDSPTAEDSVGDGDYFTFSGGVFSLERPSAEQLNKHFKIEQKLPVEWLFWRSGACEPVVVHFEGDSGTWTARYDPLTVRAAFEANVR